MQKRCLTTSQDLTVKPKDSLSHDKIIVFLDFGDASPCQRVSP